MLIINECILIKDYLFVGEKKTNFELSRNAVPRFLSSPICPSQNIQNLWNLRWESARNVRAV